MTKNTDPITDEARGYDAIVVGLGAMGSAALYQLASRGARVVGVDRFSPPHARGSSHGDTRLTRLGIGEGRHYVPLATRSHQIWRELEATTGEELLTTCGGVFFAGEDQISPVHGASDFIEETIAAAQAFGLDHEVLDVAALKNRFPQFKYHGIERGYYEPEAGFVRPERAIETQLRLAEQHGARIIRDTIVTGIDSRGDEAIVTTEQERLTAARAVITAGAWVNDFWPERLRRDSTGGDRFGVYRQMLFWFDVDGDIRDFAPDRFPVFIRTDRTRDDVLYGFPAVDGPRGGIKIASEQYDEPGRPHDATVDVTAAEIEAMHDLASRFLRIDRLCHRAVSCMFTVTPDGEFVIDFHPDHSQVIIASPCSGHGFKHSAAIGEMLAELALNGESTIDRAPFAFSRFEE